MWVGLRPLGFRVTEDPDWQRLYPDSDIHEHSSREEEMWQIVYQKLLKSLLRSAILLHSYFTDKQF